MTDFFVVVESEHVISVLRMLKLDVRTFQNSGERLEFGLGRNSAQFFFCFRFAAQHRVRFDHDLLTQSIEQGIKDNLEGLRVLGQYTLDAFAMDRQFSDAPRAAEVNPAG